MADDREADDRAISGDRIYELFSRRLQSGWLVDLDGMAVMALAERKLAGFVQSRPNFIAIATLDPIEFIATLMAGWRLEIPLFLCNPRWGESEWQQVSKLTALVDRQQHQNSISIPTGGSSGEIKFAMHTPATLAASVWGVREFYEVERINCLCTLPLYHVSGLMQLWRSLLTDGRLLISDFDRLIDRKHELLDAIDPSEYFISLVPTQLAKLIDFNLTALLAKFKTIVLGGAPPSPGLLAAARAARLPLALTYGMTETASQITSLKPAEFLAGNNSCGRVLPHARLMFNDADLLALSKPLAEKPLETRIAPIKIAAKSLMLGYFPNVNLPKYFEPDDLGKVDESGYLTIVGRDSDKIITGGENVFPIEVVSAIMSTGLVADAWVVGLPDRYWGQAVTALYVEHHLPVTAEVLAQALVGKVSNYKIPKHWLPVDRIPRNTLGKVLIAEAIEIARSRLDEINDRPI